ncbi:MAG: hypothetical protein L0H96_13385, partial [Humibacillus sp.]|nr:hypothetical protein [Humibacillus sp.]MDN5777893.1 hypothetical protein [Humibacillus sp.]
MTVGDSETLADWVEGNGASLGTVYVTHAHADHFFGATSLLRRLPAAQLRTRPEIVDAAAVQTAPGYLRVWNGFFPGQIANGLRVPEAVGDLLFTHSDVARAVMVGQSDVEVSSVVHVPDLKVVLSPVRQDWVRQVGDFLPSAR